MGISRVTSKCGTVMLTGLRDGDDIHALEHSGNGVSLDGRGLRVAAQLDVLKHHRVEAGIFELKRYVSMSWQRLELRLILTL